MMVMRRRAGESILIGDEIEIHIAEIGRSRVKIAISAPREVPIVDLEVVMPLVDQAAGVVPEESLEVVRHGRNDITAA